MFDWIFIIMAVIGYKAVYPKDWQDNFTAWFIKTSVYLIIVISLYEYLGGIV